LPVVVVHSANCLHICIEESGGTRPENISVIRTSVTHGRPSTTEAITATIKIQ